MLVKSDGDELKRATDLDATLEEYSRYMSQWHVAHLATVELSPAEIVAIEPGISTVNSWEGSTGRDQPMARVKMPLGVMQQQINRARADVISAGRLP